MKKNNHDIRLLILEDNNIDKRLIQSTIEHSDLVSTMLIVDNREGFEKALNEFKPDVVLSDYLLPDINGIQALDYHKKVLPDIPFVFITGHLSEETAIKCLKLGAWDYIMKDHIKRLPVSIKNVLDLKKEREENKQKEAVIHESEQRYKFLSELTFEGILIHDQGLVLDCNLSFCRMFGYDREELLGINITDLLIHPDDRRMVMENAKKQLTACYEARGVKKDGTVFPVEQEGKKILYNNKEVRVVAIRDITARKEALEEIKLNEEKFTKISNAAKDPIILIDHNGNVSFWNQAATDLFQYSADEILGENLHNMIVPEKYLAKHKEGFSNFLKTGEGPAVGKTLELEAKRKDGEIIPVELSLSSIYIHGKWNAVGILRDITVRKKAENELLEAKQHATDMNKMKTNFLSAMSHELRTPLNGIQGFAEILLECLDDPDYQDYARTIFKSSQRILNTFNLIIDLAVLDANKVSVFKKQTDLINIIENACESYVSEAEEKNLYLNQKLEVSEAIVEIDQTLLTQALNNLLNNAVKYTEKGGVTVGLNRCKANEVECYIVSVTDTGIGIPDEKAAVIYKAFRQVSEGYNRSYEGIGLGLYITRQYVKLLNGQLSMKSKQGEGTTFLIYIPVNSTDSLVDVETIVEDAPPVLVEEFKQKPRILYVEDDASHRQFVTLFLRKDFEIKCAHNGLEAIEEAKKQPYDLILMDINLGAGMTGLDAVEKIRMIPGYETTPIAAVTANALVSQKNAYLDSGCTDYISKPFRKQKLIEFIKDVLSVE